MSPCARCRLRACDKDNRVCMACDARIAYCATLRPGIEPPDIGADMVMAVAKQARATLTAGVYPTGRPAKGTTGAWADEKCRTPWCTKRHQGPRVPYCHGCHERNRQRKAKGISIDAPIGEGRGHRSGGRAVPHAGCIGFM